MESFKLVNNPYVAANALNAFHIFFHFLALAIDLLEIFI